ncbi:hypothetical protein RYX36_002409 [Vicia faba]
MIAIIFAQQVNYVYAQATSTLIGDLAEVNAIKKVFKDTSKLKMNGIKGLITYDYIVAMREMEQEQEQLGVGGHQSPQMSTVSSFTGLINVSSFKALHCGACAALGGDVSLSVAGAAVAYALNALAPQVDALKAFWQWLQLAMTCMITSAVVVAMSKNCPNLVVFRLCIIEVYRPHVVPQESMDEGFGVIVMNCKKLTRQSATCVPPNVSLYYLFQEHRINTRLSVYLIRQAVKHQRSFSLFSVFKITRMKRLWRLLNNRSIKINLIQKRTIVLQNIISSCL